MALKIVFKDIIKKRRLLKNNDYSFVESKSEINRLVAYGKLFPLYLMPLKFNGEDIEKNKVYVPKKIVEVKDKVDEMIEELIKKGQVSGYSCNLEYKGNSLVPSKLTVNAKKDDKVVFTETINIW